MNYDRYYHLGLVFSQVRLFHHVGYPAVQIVEDLICRFGQLFIL